MVKTEQIQVRTRGNCQGLNLTEEVSKAVQNFGLQAGVVTLFHVGSTAGLTTTEYEPGLADHDLKALFERIAPETGHYEHGSHNHVELGYFLSSEVRDFGDIR